MAGPTRRTRPSRPPGRRVRSLEWSRRATAPSVYRMKDVTVLGTGRMGSAMARRLSAGGYRVTVWNRHADRARIEGTRLAGSPAEAVTGADLVIVMLADADAVRETVAAAAMRDGTLVQMSTIGPEATRAVAAGLPGGVRFVDAPVGGSVDAAAAGTLTILASGEPEVLSRVEPVLRHLGTVKRVRDGSAAKLVVNTAMLTALGALHDTLAVAAELGVDRDVLGSGPLGAALARADSATADFPVALAAKDLRLTPGEHPVVDATLRLLAGVPDQTADVAALARAQVTEAS
jgi:3-hydroxyisobutyrate dehydrogenase-like beta-hydroxyacid dehydrogenase